MSESTLAVVHTINRIMIPLIQRRTLVFREVRWLPQITQLSDSLSLRPRKVKACVLEGQRKEGRESDLSSEGGLPPLFTGQPAIPRCQPGANTAITTMTPLALKIYKALKIYLPATVWLICFPSQLRGLAVLWCQGGAGLPVPSRSHPPRLPSPCWHMAPDTFPNTLGSLPI